jgi:hypothetical protein
MTYPIINKQATKTASAATSPVAWEYSQGTNGGAGNKLVVQTVNGLTGTLQLSYDAGATYVNVDSFDDEGNYYAAGTTITLTQHMELYWEGSGATHIQFTRVGGTTAEIRLVSTFAPWSMTNALLRRIAGAATIKQPNVDSYTQVAINLAAGANQSLVAAPGASKQIWVYAVDFTVNAAGTVSFQDEDDTAISGIMPFATNGGMATSPSGNFAMPLWKVATNKALEVDVVTSELDGSLTYGIVSV